MKTNFLNLVAKMPQNTGGGNSQTKRATLALPLRYLCAMLLTLVLGVGNMWGETWTAANIVNKSGAGTKKGHITVSSPGVTSTTSSQMYKPTSGDAVSENAVSIATSSTVSTLEATPYIEIKADRGYRISAASFYGGAVNNNNQKIWIFCWNTIPIALQTSSNQEYTLQNQKVTSKPDDQDIILTSSTRVVRIYSKIKHSSGLIGSGSGVGGGKGAIVSVSVTEALAPEIEGDSQMLNDETITLTGYPSGGSWNVVSGPGAIDESDGKLTASGNGTIQISYTYSDVTVTKDITAAATKMLVWNFDTNGTLPTTADVTVVSPEGKNGGFNSDGTFKLSSNGHYAYIDLTAKNLVVTAAVLNAKTGSASKPIDFGSAASDVADGTTSNSSSTNFENFEITPIKESHIFSVIKNSGTSATLKQITLTVKKYVAPPTYTITLNPNGGSYASTPDGWTESAGVYTKTVTAGALTIPEPSKSKSEFNGWKSGLEDVALSDGKLTVTKDTTLTAQWGAERETPEVTFTNGAYVVGATALDLSKLFTSDNTNAVTFALKVASEDATVSGSGFTATKAGSYVVVATQAADANYKAVSEEATITVTYPATGSATISYVLDVTNNGTILQTTRVDKNISTISASASTTLLAGGLGTGGSNNGDKNKHNGTRTLGINVLPSEDANKYFYVTLSVADGYEFTPSAISLKVLTIGGDDSHPVSYKAVLTDGVNSITGTATATSDAELSLDSWSGLNSTTLSGDVTLKLYAWYTTSDTYNAYRLSTPITITGTVAEYVAPSGYAITKSATNGTIAVTDGSDAITSADAGDKVYIAATPSTGYEFASWDVYKTGETSTKVTLDTDDDTDNKTRKFTMPAYALTVGATFSAVDYTVTHSAATNGTYTIKVGTADAVSTNTTANYGQTVTLVASPNTGYTFSSWTVLQGETPVSVTNNSFTMPAGNVTVSASFALEPNVYYYKSSSRYDGSAYKNPEGNDAGSGDNIALTTPWKICDACVTGVTKVEATSAVYDSKGNHMNAYIKMRKDDNGKIVFTIAENYKATIKIKMGGYSGANTNITMKLNDSGDNIAYSGTMSGAGTTENEYAELTYANLAAGAYTLKPTSGSLYISQIDIQTTPIYTVTHTLTGASTSSATKVSAGEEYSATYTAETGYSLPASITVKVGGSTIDAENYTWNQSTGALIIPAVQVTGNIQIIIAGEFTCPEAASGDVVFSWTPKTSLANADISAGTYDLPGEWLESVYGGSAEIYVNADEAMRIRNNQLAFNGNNAYVHLTICALAEGDRILVNSSNETNARNLWISLDATRPDNAEAAAAVIEQGKAYYISSTSPLKGVTALYIWREGSTTQIGEVSIIRSKKFTVTYAASDLTGGEVPAAVSNIFDGQTIIVAGKGTMEKGAMLFNGWKDANEVSYAAGANFEVTANTTLTAQWSQLYTVTYAKAGTEEGTVPTQESLLDGAKFNVADQGSLVTPANKVFGGWNDGSQTYAAGAEYTIDGANVTLTAVWNNNYTVQYDANGGEGSMENGTGSVITIAANGFTYDNHKFLRWNSQPDGEGTNYAVGAEVSESLTLYAIWKEVTCTAGTNIFSIAFTNTTNVNMADGNADKDMSSYATIVGGSAFMSYFRSGSNANVLTYSSSTSKASIGTNAQYLQLNLDCALQAGDVITIVSESGNKTAIASELADDRYPLNATKKENTSTTNTYTVRENDNIENADVLYIGRNTSSGSLTFTEITIYRPLPDASVPTIDDATPADATYGGGATILAMTVSADAEGAKALHYQWYKEAGETDVAVGTDAASYTPIASGDYYCVVTNSPTGYSPKSATSRTATITMISSDATLAWLKADGNDIALSDGYAYEYVIADAATVAPTITAGKNEEHASVTITQADSKTGTATVHVVAEDGETSHDYTVKFNEFSGCLTTFYFSYADDADENHVTNNAQLRGHTVFTNVPSDGSSYGGTLTVNEENYTATRSTSSVASFGKLVVPEKYAATLYLLVRIGSSNTALQLIKDGESTPYMSSDVYEEAGTYQYNFENVQAGTYTIRALRNGNVQNCNYIAMAAELCRYEIASVSLANMTLRTGESAAPVMTITPAKGAVVSQAWSFVDATAAVAAGLSINATGVVSAEAEATPGAYAVKVVLNGDNALSATCTVTVITEYSQVDVTGTTEWDFATGKAASSKITIENEDIILANADGITNDETFNSQALRVNVKYVSNAQLQGKSIMFHTTIPGLLTVRYACTSSKDADRVLYINDYATTSKTDNAEVTYTQAVPSGDVTIKAIFDDGGTPTVDLMNYKYIKFDTNFVPAEAEESTLGGYEREVNPQYYGTICLPKAGVIAGATLFELAYMDYKEDNVTPYKVYYDEVLNGELEAGMPYIFLAHESTIGVFYTGTATNTAQHKNGLHGTLEDITSGMNGENKYMLYNNQVLHSTSAASSLPANRAYIQLDEVPGYGNPGYRAAPAKPGRRRISTGFNAPQIATGLEDAAANEKPVKVLINGELYILRGEKMYDATGRLVK